jgi:hypothetical protein
VLVPIRGCVLVPISNERCRRAGRALALMTAARAARSFGAMTSSLSRRAGTALIAGALLTIASAVAMGVVTASTTVSDDLFRYPMTHDAFIAFSAFAAVVHLILLVGIVGLRRSGLAGPSRGARAGLACVIGGTALLFLSEWGSIAVVDQDKTDAGASVVMGGFGLATLLVTFGMLAAGRATLRSGGWASWRRYAPLICGALSLVVIPIQFTPVLWLGVAIYGLGYMVLGVALVTEEVPEPSLQAA